MTAVRVLAGGTVYTSDAARSWAEAVAIGDGRILAVGSDEQVRAQYPEAEFVDVVGR
ncbi:MAG: amidohydrolase, partial [bacterium]|nr:amidohydrolase [bacterium]